jgi:hypothetical protein
MLIENVRRLLEQEEISTGDQLEQAINWRMRQFLKAKKSKPGCELLHLCRTLCCQLTVNSAPQKASGRKPPRGEQRHKGCQSSILGNETNETEPASDEEEMIPEHEQEGDGLAPMETRTEAVSEEQMSRS